MSLSLIDLAILIELVEEKLQDYEFEASNPKNSEAFQNDYSELLVQLGNTAGNLEDEYEEQYSPEIQRPRYDELIKGIRDQLQLAK